MTSDPLDTFRRAAKALKAAYEQGAPAALERLRFFPPRADGAELKHADFLHVIARENSYVSWPAMKAAIGTLGLDRATKRKRLGLALHNKQPEVAQRLLSETPDLAEGDIGLLCALYDAPGVGAMLADDASMAINSKAEWSPLSLLCKSRMWRVWPDRQEAALAIAGMLIKAGADVNESSPRTQAPALSPLYWALGYAGHVPLARALLEYGANPDDGESLYHATELGHVEGVKLLLEHGATIEGTNALPRAMDFDNAEMVSLLLHHGADPNEGCDAWTAGTGLQSGVPVLHQAARRMNTGPVLDLLLDAGADPAATWQGHSAYAFACVFGNADLRQRIEARGGQSELTRQEQQLAQAADGHVVEGYINTDTLPDAYQNLLREIVHLPGKLPQMKALVNAGMAWDKPDAEGLTPVQVAGWSGLPDVMAYFLSLKPDLGHVNSYGGTLFSTILHGASNNPHGHDTDYIECLRLALEEGVALPRRAIDAVGDPKIKEFLVQWAKDKPGQVVEHGVY